MQPGEKNELKTALVEKLAPNKYKNKQQIT